MGSVGAQKIGGGGRNTYTAVPSGHSITVSRSRGDMTLTSYGEGWKDGYHVEHTDRYGGEFIDAGKVGDYTIGDKVLWKYNPSDIGEPKEVEITFAHRYPNGNVEYTVRDSSGDGHSATAETLNMYKTGGSRITAAQLSIMTTGQIESLMRGNSLSRDMRERAEQILRNRRRDQELQREASRW